MDESTPANAIPNQKEITTTIHTASRAITVSAETIQGSKIAQINTHDFQKSESIYWKGDKKWYSGTVFRPIASQPGVFRIKFDDGTTDNFKYDPAKWRKIKE